MKPVTLVTKPTVNQETKFSIVKQLREVLAQAEAGNIEGVAIIALHSGGQWSCNDVATTQLSEMLGRIEVVKHLWITQIIKLNGHEGRPKP